jgi:hypothetical protein
VCVVFVVCAVVRVRWCVCVRVRSQILSEWGDGLSEHATSKIAATAKSRKVLSPAQLEQGPSVFPDCPSNTLKPQT